MKLSRVIPVLLVFATVGLGLVYLRAEQARSASAALRHEAEWFQLKRDLWDLEARVARLRSPEQLHQRMVLFDLGLTLPDRDSLPHEGSVMVYEGE